MSTRRSRRTRCSGTPGGPLTLVGETVIFTPIHRPLGRRGHRLPPRRRLRQADAPCRRLTTQRRLRRGRRRPPLRHLHRQESSRASRRLSDGSEQAMPRIRRRQTVSPVPCERHERDAVGGVFQDSNRFCQRLVSHPGMLPDVEVDGTFTHLGVERRRLFVGPHWRRRLHVVGDVENPRPRDDREPPIGSTHALSSQFIRLRRTLGPKGRLERGDSSVVQQLDRPAEVQRHGPVYRATNSRHDLHLREQQQPGGLFGAVRTPADIPCGNDAKCFVASHRDRQPKLGAQGLKVPSGQRGPSFRPCFGGARRR